MYLGAGGNIEQEKMTRLTLMVGSFESVQDYIRINKIGNKIISRNKEYWILKLLPYEDLINLIFI